MRETKFILDLESFCDGLIFGGVMTLFTEHFASNNFCVFCTSVLNCIHFSKSLSQLRQMISELPLVSKIVTSVISLILSHNFFDSAAFPNSLPYFVESIALPHRRHSLFP